MVLYIITYLHNVTIVGTYRGLEIVFLTSNFIYVYFLYSLIFDRCAWQAYIAGFFLEIADYGSANVAERLFYLQQVHLICMPPTHDNICQKSAKYHFVNEYLYRPINEEEVQRKPNVSLKYSDRYYPAEVYHDDRFEEDEEGEEVRARVAAGASLRLMCLLTERLLQEEAPRKAAPAAVRHSQPAATPTARTQPTAQVFRSPEEVNIPLLQRRPQRPYDFDF